MTEETLIPTADLRTAEAWNAIKKPEDNDFTNLPMEMKHKLSQLAEKALRGESAQEGDYAPEGFFEKVVELSGLNLTADAPIVTHSEPPTFGEKVKDFFADPFGKTEHVDTENPAPNPPESDAPPKELKGPLPDDFPGRAALAEEGINTYGQLRKRIEAGTLNTVPHIGIHTAAKIEAKLSE